MEITKNTNIAKILEEHPETAEIFMKYGLHCVGCMAAGFDSLEQGAKTHGLSDETVEELVEDLNSVKNGQ
ncbi:DUF1858 domain-containing protein [candidate division WWE3 bacterium]|nr:DUF1858 domain-containing protein [candidate division WWE3 bacterium]